MIWRVYIGWLVVSAHWEVHATRTGQRLELMENVRSLFYHGFDSYMDHAFPEDELRPLSCTGRGSDRKNPKNIGINDVCGDFALTLVDTLDMLPILGDQVGFESGVRAVIDTVTFDVDSKVQIFEVTIRILGGLLSAHQYATLPYLNSTISWYQNELLDLAIDLGHRLLPAFDSATGIPHPRINLKYGMAGLSSTESTETCAAGAGTLLLEFFALSQLSGQPVFQEVADRAFRAIWERRSELGLVGNTIDVNTGVWTSSLTSIGAGVDSFYEYALKAWVLLGDDYYHSVWNSSRSAITEHIADEQEFLHRTIHVKTGFLATNYIDSLTAFYPGLLVLAGELEQAIKGHLIYQSLWTRYQAIPERFNFVSKQVEIPWYPLRPEFIESTYFLYRATKDPFYLSVGQQIVEGLTLLKQPCGFAGLGNVVTRTLDDRMESFMLSESLKYLFLLFDEDHHLNKLDSNWVFTTEGHPLFLAPTHRTPRRDNFSSAAGHSCQVPPKPDFFSAAMSRKDFFYAQSLVGLDLDVDPLPVYFPTASPRSFSEVPSNTVGFDILFGSVASSVINTSANIVSIGRSLVIKSLLGVKFRFAHIDSQLVATRIGSRTVDRDTEVHIKDLTYESFSSGDLVQWTLGGSVDIDVYNKNDKGAAHKMLSTTSIYGSKPPFDLSLRLLSVLATDNSKGCLCPATFDKSATAPPEQTAIVMLRGDCSFFEKSMNAYGAARLVIVVDPGSGPGSDVRPELVDAEGKPMSSNASYPSLVVVRGANQAALLNEATSVILRGPVVEERAKLIVQGQVVTNVFVST